MNISLLRTQSDLPDFRKLIRELDKELDDRYGFTNRIEYGPYNQVDHIQTVVVAYQDDQAVGCGCSRPYDEKTIEIKRFYLHPSQRGSGIAGLIIRELEQWGREAGYERAILETGVKQPDSIRFYTKNGYSTIPNYGQYEGKRGSVCMEKSLKE